MGNENKIHSDKKKKILQVTRYAYPHIGGIESVISQINAGLSNDEFDKEVLCCSNIDISSEENDVKYTRCRFLFEFAANTISPQFILKLSKVDTDILHYHMPFIFAVIAHFIARPKYKKMVITYHSDIVGYDKIMRFFWWIYKKFLKAADIIHVLSPQLVENSFIKDFKEKTVIIPFSVDANTHHDTMKAEEIRRKYSGKKILFALGRHVKYKGFMYLLEAMKKVSGACLLLGGNGPLTQEFKEYIKDNNLGNKVILTGRIPDSELENYYEACDIYVLPSIMQFEAFAVVQLDAMKHSKPVINTWLGTGVNYVSINEKTGITVQPENSDELAQAINTLLNDEQLRQTYGMNAKARVEELFLFEKIKEKYNNLYKI